VTAPAPEERVLDAEDIVVHRGGTLILTSASLRLDRGTITALAGRNGAGKSTLFDAIAGVRPPTSGRVRVGAHTRWRWRQCHVARMGLFLWPQQGYLSRGLSVDTQCAWMAARWDTPRALHDEVFDSLPSELRRTHVLALSPGERRRVEAAILRLRQPLVVLADEPFAGAAPVAAESFAGHLQQLARDGAAVCFTSHEWWLVEAFADRVVHCTSRTTLDVGTPHEARGNHAFRTDFLG
jgi:ABC-type multidrug transport system ATPase subunit